MNWLWFRIGAALVLVVALWVGVQAIRHTYAERDQLRSQVETLVEQSRLIKRSTAATIDALAQRSDDRVRIVTVTKEVLREIPQLVPAGSPDLPAGFRVLHDAAAAGVLPAATGAPDAGPVSAAAVAETVVSNYGTCLDTFNQLERLQQWLKAQSPSTPASAP